MDALFAEAEQVYRKFVAEDTRLVRAGQMPDSAMNALLAGPIVAAYATDRENQRKAGYTAQGDVSVRYVEPAHGQSYEGSEIAIKSCVDGSTLSVQKAGKAIGTGLTVEGFTYFKSLGGSLKVWWQTTKEVSSCGQ